MMDAPTKADAKDAAVAPTSTTPEKLLCSSSMAKTTPAMGALKAAARPAAAPLDMRKFRALKGRRARSPNACPTEAPICTEGPSLPMVRPPPSVSRPPMNLPGSTRRHGTRSRPASCAETCGMPLPEMSGANFVQSPAAAPIRIIRQR